MRLIVDHHDGFSKAVLPQRGRDLKACMPRADDENGSLRHRDSPTVRAQELPMWYPLAHRSRTLKAKWWVHRFFQSSRGLSPLAFCYLLASQCHFRDFPMSTPVPSHPLSDDPALLRIDGAVATITLNRPS